MNELLDNKEFLSNDSTSLEPFELLLKYRALPHEKQEIVKQKIDELYHKTIDDSFHNNRTS